MNGATLASGDELDSIGRLLGVRRETCEADWSYRRRLAKKAKTVPDA